MNAVQPAVVIGRFSPYTAMQHAQMRVALRQPGPVAVVIGSAHHPRTPRDPFTWREREAMIRLCLPEEAAGRVTFIPLRDYYRDDRWAEALKRSVRAVVPETRHAHLVPTSTRNLECYREWLPEWPQVEPGGATQDDKALVRALLAAGDAVESAFAAIAPRVPPEIVDYLRAWVKQPHFGELVAEQRSNAEENAKWRGAPYPPVFTTVDAVVRACGHVLLVKRGHRPGRGLWALPGGFIDVHERLLTSAIRELHEETSLAIPAEALRRRLKDVIVLDHPDRAVRARTITHAHYFELPDEELPEVRGSDDAAEARWTPIADLAAMEEHFFEDHFHILDHFLQLTKINGVVPQLI